VPHDRNPRDPEVGRDVARDPRPLAQQVEDSASRWIGEGKPNRSVICPDLRAHNIGVSHSTRNASITYRIRPGKEVATKMNSLIRYKTKPETADHNQRLVENVYAELTARDPGGVRYATLRLDDRVTFMHLFATDSDEAANTLGDIAAFSEFLRELPQRCAELPVTQPITVVGSYRMFGS
jgi:hypothetical protein